MRVRIRRQDILGLSPIQDQKDTRLRFIDVLVQDTPQDDVLLRSVVLHVDSQHDPSDIMVAD
jgi:hypothetical protein